MKVLGISGSQRDAAAALSVDGAVVAAVTEDVFARARDIGYASNGDWPAAAVDACLRIAGVAPGQIDSLAIVDDDDRPEHGPGAPMGGVPVPAAIRAVRRTVGGCHADARQITATSPLQDALLVVMGFEPGTHAAFQQRGSELRRTPGLCGGEALSCAVQRVVDATGCHAFPGTIPAQSRDIPAPLAREIDLALQWNAESGFVVDQNRVGEVLGALERLKASLADSLLNVEYQHLARAIAAALLSRLEALVLQIAETLRDRAGISRVGFGGALFGHPALATAVVRAFGSDAVLAPVPDASGRAIGAALEGAPPHRQPLGSLALGPSFSEEEVKQTLDNCRLTYLYEPEWPRLHERVSRLLARGTLVGWFQGALGFGPQATAGRTILSDPSNRWARENVNTFLRRVPVETPLPLAVLAGVGPWQDASVRRFAWQNPLVPVEWRHTIVAALNGQNTAQVQVVADADGVPLCDLLRLHYARTGVPALTTAPFSGPGEATVCTPRDAIRAMFSSPVDALVIERFIIAKDYWLLGSHAD